jgi:UDP-N-acetylmuramoyl-L-alanyl-D-glutamate--2,6-diaminopimelate ligase
VALTVGRLCSGLPGLEPTGHLETQITEITSDSRLAGPDVLFVAVPGKESDGHAYVPDVLATGCLALALQKDRLSHTATLPQDFAGSVILAERTRPLPALFGSRLHDHPDRRLWTAAVTGTNGKTTVSYLMREMLNSLHGPCGLLGTIAYEDGRASQPAPLTTPGGEVFYDWLGRMVANGCRSVAVELSSHGLDQDRTAGLHLDVAVMTNLSRDHLDYHQDLEAYLAAKTRILEFLGPGNQGQGTGKPGILVVNRDDPHLAGLDTGQHETIWFSTKTGPGSPQADLQVLAAKLELEGTGLVLDWRGRRLTIASPLVGRFNVENLTAALAAGVALGLDPEDCSQALGGVPQIPGRLERFVLPGGGLAVVDYAHTPDALEAVLKACDELTDRQVLVVFGCGGDRDRGKRPLMGRVAARGSDRAWITSDNPRSEEPGGICRDILAGFDEAAQRRATSRELVVDRQTAIEAALGEAGPGDIVVVAGKGHEDYQLIGTRVVALDDRVIIQDWIERNQAHD